MSLELINAVASLLTVCIIAATAIAAMAQLRHLRAGNQISAMLSIGEELSAERFVAAGQLVRRRLPDLVDDPEYRSYNAARDAGGYPKNNADFEELRTALNTICNAFEELGILVKNGIVDAGLFLDRYSWVIHGWWSLTEKSVADAREATGQVAVWENFEYLAVMARDWMRTHPSTFPKGMARMPLPARPPLKT